MSILNDKELFKLRDDILAGTVVIVTKDHFNQLELVAVSRSELLKACENAVKQMQDDPVQGVGEWQQGLFCGLEDREINDRYEACQYGYNKALDKVQERIIDELATAIAKAKV